MIKSYENKLILLVEDEAIIAAVETKALRQYGYNVITAGSGDEALEIFRENKAIDLILMDIDLGKGIDGPDTARKILEERDIPVVFLSGHTEPEVVEKTEKITSYGYVVKNSGITVLDASIKMAFKLFEANIKLVKKDIIHDNILKNLRDTLYKLNFRTGRYDFISPSIFDITGFTSEECINMGVQGLIEYIHPDDRPEVENYFMHRSLGQKTHNFLEYRIRYKDGEYRWVSDSCSVIFDDSGNPDYIIGNVRDINESKNIAQELQLKNEELTATNEEFEAALEELSASNSELYQTQIVLNESEEKYRSLFSGNRDGIVFINQNGQFIDANRSYCDMLGYTIDELRNMENFYAITPEKCHKPEKEIWNGKLIPDGYSGLYEKEYIHKDGSIFPVELHAFTVPDRTGEVMYLWAVVRNISERKSAESSLRASEEKFRLLVENSHDIIYTIMADGILTFVSPSWTAILGHPVNQVVGQPFDIFVHPDDVPECAVRISKIIEKGEKQEGVEYRVKHADGSWYWHTSNTVPLRDENGVIVGFEGIAKDITVNKRAEAEIKKQNEKLEMLNEELNAAMRKLETANRELVETSEALQEKQKTLQESEAKYSSYAENAPDGVFVSDKNGHFIEVNKAASLLTGYTREELLQMSYSDFITVESLETEFAYFKTLSGTGSVIGELCFMHKDGTNRWASLDAVKITDSLFIDFIKDITDRKLAEDKIKALIAEKELILKEVHHRVKNFMNNITGLLMMQADSQEDSSVASALGDAISRVKSMSLLYDKLFISHGFPEISVASYLSTLVDEIIANFPNRAKVRVVKRLDDLPLEVNKLQPLGIIVNELITNIMKYAFTGRSDGLIEVSLAMPGNCLRLVIKDNGIGIPEPVSFKNSTGFGMQLVDMLASQIGATIKLEREGGTSFVLELTPGKR